MRSFSTLCCAALVMISGCDDATGLVVFVDSDLHPETELFAVEASTGVEVGGVARRFPITEVGLPFSFGVEAPPGAHSARVSVHLVGQDPTQRSIIHFRAATEFRPGRTLVLPAPLARACQPERCEGTDLVCRSGECVDPFVDPATLGSREPDRLFDGPSEPDPVDAGSCVAGEACDSGNPCRPGSRRCDPAETCEPGPAMPAGTDCGDGRVCDADGRCGR